MIWQCSLSGRIRLPNGKVRTVERFFDGAGDVRGKALEELQRRKDRGSPWYGDFVYVTTPLGQLVIVNVPWPGETKEDEEIEWQSVERINKGSGER